MMQSKPNHVLGSFAGLCSFAVISAMGCNGMPAPAANPCPPLPMLEKRATAAEIQLHHHTVISMYAQCAGSKQ